MMGRAWCLHRARYSTDAAAILQMIREEFDEEEKAYNKQFIRHRSQQEALW